MHEKRQRLQSALNAADFPGEILTGVPVVELHGSSEAVVINHRGILSYGKEQIRIGSSVGPVTLEGEGLEVFRMNRERIVLHGRIRSVSLAGGKSC